MPGSSWVTLPAASYKVRKNGTISTAQLEVDVRYNEIIAHPAENEWSAIAPLR